MTIASADKSGTISPAGSVDVDLDLGVSQHVSVVISNTGPTNAITSVTVKKSPTGQTYGTDAATGTAIGSVAAGGNVLLELAEVACRALRLTLASTGGTTYRVEMRGVR